MSKGNPGVKDLFRYGRACRGRLIVNSPRKSRTVYAKTAKAPSARPKAATSPDRETPAADAPLAGVDAAAPAALAPVVLEPAVLLAVSDARVLVALLLLAAAIGTAMCSCNRKKKVRPDQTPP